MTPVERSTSEFNVSANAPIKPSFLASCPSSKAPPHLRIFFHHVFVTRSNSSNLSSSLCKFASNGE